ncbi:MAG: geranylgeranyl reductase family protein [Propionibacteriaceae bacterium]
MDADVIVVGAGPGGSATATHLAKRGLSVLLLEKTKFPREKVCGDGLTPRSVRELTRLGIDTSEAAGWHHIKGLRIYGGKGAPLEMPWPELKDFPNYGMTRSRQDFDQLLAQHAVSNGVELRENTTVTEPILDDTGRIIGVRTKDGQTFHAPIVVAADGNSSRLALGMGIHKRDDRPMGVAVRAYFESPQSSDDWMESWLELWDGEPHKSTLLSGYGWVFPMNDGTCNVGLGMLSSSKGFQSTDYRDLMKRWLDNTPEELGFREANRVGDIRGAALPMGFNRKPHYANGLLLVGDSGGMISPYNGEGISYAMEAGSFAADCIADAKARGFGTAQAELALRGYITRLESEWGGYYRLGGIFSKLIGQQWIMKVCTEYGLPRKKLMYLVNKLLAHLVDEHDGDAVDRLITTLSRLTPSA